METAQSLWLHRWGPERDRPVLRLQANDTHTYIMQINCQTVYVVTHLLEGVSVSATVRVCETSLLPLISIHPVSSKSALIWHLWSVTLLCFLFVFFCFLLIVGIYQLRSIPAQIIFSLKCPTVSVPVCLCVFNRALRPDRIRPMTAQQTETLFSSHYKVSLSLLSSGNCSRDSIKVNDIACMCSISAGTGRKYVTLRKRELRR